MAAGLGMNLDASEPLTWCHLTKEGYRLKAGSSAPLSNTNFSLYQDGDTREGPELGKPKLREEGESKLGPCI